MKEDISYTYVIEIVRRCFVLTAALVVLLPLKPANAVEELTFKPAKDSGPSLRLQLDEFLKRDFKSDSSEFSIASTDLNGDNLLEHILKRNNCGQYTNTCTHLIVAEKNDGLTLLSKINAHRLMVGDDANYGIKDLLAFKNQTNAYNFDIYMWSPKEKMYILRPDKKRD